MNEPTTESAVPIPGRRSSLRYSLPIGIAAAVLVAYVGLRVGGIGVTRNPSKAAALRAQAEALDRAGRGEEAIATYREAIAADPRDVETHRGYQNAMRKAKREDEAIADYAARAAANPRDPMAAYLAARILKTDDERLEAMKKVVAAAGHYVHAHRTLAMLYRGRNELALARPHVEACAKSREATIEDLLDVLRLCHELNDTTHVGEWLLRWPEVTRGVERGMIHCVYLAKEGPVKSITMWLPDHADPLTYLLLIAREDRGTRWIGVKRAGGLWAMAESPGWATTGQAVPDPNSLLRDVPGRDANPPDYPQLFGRAMRYLREEKE